MNVFADSKITFDGNLKSTRDGCSEGLISLGDKDDIVVLTADLPESTRVLDFAKKFPDKYFNVGVAEQNLAGIGAGLALSGKIPFISSFGVFSPGRNWDQLRVSICYSKANVKLLSSHTGLGVGEDGATHQALEDIAITRVLPNLTVLCPADSIESKKAVRIAYEHDGPVYIRYGRQGVKTYTTDESPFIIGKALKISEGENITIATTGVMLERVIEAAKRLEEVGISSDILHYSSIKPFDQDTLLQSAAKTKAVLTVEDHQIIGGFGSAVSEVLSMNLPTKVGMVGMHDSFGKSAPFEQLYKEFNMDADGIFNKARELLGR